MLLPTEMMYAQTCSEAALGPTRQKHGMKGHKPFIYDHIRDCLDSIFPDWKSDSDLTPPISIPRPFVVCTDTSPFVEHHLCGEEPCEYHDSQSQYGYYNDARHIFNPCPEGSRAGACCSGMASKLAEPHCSERMETPTNHESPVTRSQSQTTQYFSGNGSYELSQIISSCTTNNSIAPQLNQANDTADCPGSPPGSVTELDPER